MSKITKTGLILEGGGMRGVFTAGILDFFIEKGLEFDTCFGVSAGACMACSYLSKQKGRGYHTFTDYMDNPEYCGIKSLIKTGDYFGTDMIYRKIPEKLNPYDYDTYNRQKTKFYAVVTNCESGNAEYKEIKDMKKGTCYVRASSSLPLMSRTVWIHKKPYLDGGITDSIPIMEAQRMGNKKNVVVLTRDRTYRKEKNKLIPAMKVRYGKKFPKLIEALENRHIGYNQTLDYLYRQEKEGKVFILQPQKPVEIGRLEKDTDKLHKLYEEGYETAQNYYEALKESLEN